LLTQKRISPSTRLVDSGTEHARVAPPLKWAGGKTQLLGQITRLVPPRYGTYIEPFFGGGALFFALLPARAIISDSNPELVAFYAAVRDDVDGVIKEARRWQANEATFYQVRRMDPVSLAPATRAARLLYLNRTCYNGLYRVNRTGIFNVPYGKYRSPKICDEAALRAASLALKGASIVCADFRTILREHVRSGDFLFLDPPYVPAGRFADFKRYTKEQFGVRDHLELAGEVGRLRDLGCHVVLTNSNTELARHLYQGFDFHVARTRRNISCQGGSRIGEDLVVSVLPRQGAAITGALSEQTRAYPSTRFMGSKEKLLPDIWGVAKQLGGTRVLDLFSGSGVVSYMFKAQGLEVTSNDYMVFAALFARAMIENSRTRLSEAAVEFLTQGAITTSFVQDHFRGLYFSDEDTKLVDTIRSRIQELDGHMEKTLARAALIRACMKKRARGIFTYVGLRYDDGRRDMQLPLREHFRDAVRVINGAVFDNARQNIALDRDALTVEVEADIVYIDPPYYSKLSDNDYVRRYHFVEGLAREWIGVELQAHTATKKFKSYGSPFSTYGGAVAAFERIFQRFANSSLIVSYSSNSLPDSETMLKLLRRYKHDVEILPVRHRYSFGNQGHKPQNSNNKVSEYLFVAR